MKDKGNVMMHAWRECSILLEIDTRKNIKNIKYKIKTLENAIEKKWEFRLTGGTQRATLSPDTK